MRKLINSDICIVNGLNNKFNKLYFDYFDKNNTCRLVLPKTLSDLDSVLLSADIALCCWCDNIPIYLSNNKERLHSKTKIFTYIRSYEMLTDQFIDKVNWKNISGIIFVANHVQEYANNKFRALKNIPQTVVYNSVDLNNVPFYGDITNNNINIGFISYINHKKGITLLMQCLKAAVEFNKSIKFHIAGSFQEERYKYYIEHFVRLNDLTNNIYFYNWVDDIYSWLKDINFTISTSPWEGCPNNVIESMATGVMPIVHNWPGASDLFPSELVFDTVDDFIKILKDNINSYSYFSRQDLRGIVEEKFNSKNNLQQLDNFISCQLPEKSINIDLKISSKDNNKTIIRWLCGGNLNAASTRLRALKINDAINKYFNKTIDSDIITDFSKLEPCDILILQRQYGKHVSGVIDHYKSNFDSKIVLDLTDVYPEAVETSKKCDMLITSSKYRIEQLKDVGFNIPIYYIDDPVDYNFEENNEIDISETILSDDIKPVWFGTYSNIKLLHIISKIVDKGTAITSVNVKLQIPKNWEFNEWNYDTFLDTLRKYNVCLLPQSDPGKSSNKLVTALLCGLPCIMSDIPSYREIAEIFSITEYLCEEKEQWIECFNKLKDPKNRIDYLQKVHNTEFSDNKLDYKLQESPLYQLYSSETIARKLILLFNKTFGK